MTPLTGNGGITLSLAVCDSCTMKKGTQSLQPARPAVTVAY